MNDQVKITPTTADQLLAGQHVSPFNVFAPQSAPVPVRDPWRPKKVAILGTAPSSRAVAPFNDPTWTIWGSSPGNQNALPRVDAWFEMHSNLLWPQYASYGKPYVQWLNEQSFPVIAQDNSIIKRAAPYPIEEMLRVFPHSEYFYTSTFAYMMAFAISRGVEEMGLFGVDMSSQDEYIQQRSGGHYFLIKAWERGIKVTVPLESDLLQPPPLYGYVDSTPIGRKNAAREEEVIQRCAALEQELGKTQAQLTYLKGAREDVQYYRQVWAGAQLPFAGYATYYKQQQFNVAPPPPIMPTLTVSPMPQQQMPQAWGVNVGPTLGHVLVPGPIEKNPGHTPYGESPGEGHKRGGRARKKEPMPEKDLVK